MSLSSIWDTEGATLTSQGIAHFSEDTLKDMLAKYRTFLKPQEDTWKEKPPELVSARNQLSFEETTKLDILRTQLGMPSIKEESYQYWRKPWKPNVQNLDPRISLQEHLKQAYPITLDYTALADKVFKVLTTV